MESSVRPRILMVDDTPANLVALEAILAPLDAELVKADSALPALKALLRDDFSVILLDVQMPGMDGFKLASLIKTRERSRRTPIIFLTAIHSEPAKIFQGYAQGAVDYLVKPFDPEILRSKAAVFVELWRKTEQVRTQQIQLHEHERLAQERRDDLRFRTLTDALPGCIWVADPDGHIHYANERWLAYRGGDASADLGFFTALPAADQPRVRARWQDSVDHRAPLELEVQLRAVGGEYRWHLLRALPQTDGDGSLVGWIAAAFDIDEQKRFEAERAGLLEREQAARAQAEVANHAKDDFLATVSHELRTPLTAILGWTRMLRTGAVAEGGLPRALATIERNARVQAQLIEDILDVSRIVSGKLRVELRRIDLRSVAQAALDAISPAAQAKGIELAADLAGDAVECLGDPDRLQQVLSNLLTNAIKFTPRGGRVALSLRGAQDGSAEFAELDVTDTGSGIAPDFLPHVFQRFRQADNALTRSQTGLGLGLAIVRHLVDLHGGSVEAHSDGEGKGARFAIRLPLCAPANLAEVPAIALAVNEARKATKLLAGLKVLVVDDEPDARELLMMVLREAGADAVAAGSADEAIDQLQRELPDVLLSDIGLPREDGYALIRRVRALDSAAAAAVPAAALTGRATGEDGRLAVEAGFQRHIAKPVDSSALLAIVAELAGRVDELQERRARLLKLKPQTAAS